MTDAATEKFAALLRELKQRSGRSYGSLAARLHVSTSTLHRYCNGDAVPASYAPAEHLARLCGATPEELVELHRRWHRANPPRRGPAAGGGPARPSWAAGNEPAAGGGSSSDGSDAAAAASGAGSPADGGRAASRAPGTAGTSGSGGSGGSVDK
ncbi:helix-turn-helix transcriptional regulator, partial [Streptomyces synnematoformans]|uniref:helix-turn-helix domain-containing protein n=1 Tax=Streptomyces synnematoformans TaxID=415721 RepID=UPI0031D45115